MVLILEQRNPSICIKFVNRNLLLYYLVVHSIMHLLIYKQDLNVLQPYKVLLCCKFETTQYDMTEVKMKVLRQKFHLSNYCSGPFHYVLFIFG